MQKTYKLVTTKSIFIITIIVSILTFTGVMMFDVGQYKNLFRDSLLAMIILSSAFFLFLVIGLYKGIKLKDNIGAIQYKSTGESISDVAYLPSFPFPEISDGIEGFIISMILWLLMGIIFILIGGILAEVFGALIFLFAAMLYWIFFRALRLVFKKSNVCKNNFWKSIGYALLYTSMYNAWIYGVILGIHYLRKF